MFLVLLRMQVSLATPLLHRLRWSMQDGHNDLLGLVAIEGVVLVNIRGLNVAC